jgi:hypothetical protein
MLRPMNLIRPWWWAGVLLGLSLAGAGAAPSAGENYLLWDKARGRVDASVRTWDTLQVLRRVAASTRWQIYLEPNTHQVLPTRFRNLPEGEALRRLLGDLNYAQVAPSNAPPRLYVFRTTRDEATQLVPGLDPETRAKAKPIEDELIVKLKPGESIEDLARRLGAVVAGRLKGLNAYRLKFEDADKARQARESLGNDSSVAAVDYNYSIPRTESPESATAPPPRFALQPKAPADGKSVIVGLIDSLVLPNEGRYGDFILEPVVVASGGPNQGERATHGPAMAETILNGVSATLDKDSSSSIRILPVDVYGNSPTTTTFDVAMGIIEARDRGARIINLSLGSDGDSAMLHEVISSSHQQGVVFFAAAGNEPVTSPTYPAAYPEATAVTAVDRTGAVTSYANRGNFVAVGGPGTVYVNFNGQTYVMSGTSASTAYVSGVAAALAEQTGRPVTEVEKALPTLMPVRKE